MGAHIFAQVEAFKGIAEGDKHDKGAIAPCPIKEASASKHT